MVTKTAVNTIMVRDYNLNELNHNSIGNDTEITSLNTDMTRGENPVVAWHSLNWIRFTNHNRHEPAFSNTELSTTLIKDNSCQFYVCVQYTAVQRHLNCTSSWPFFKDYITLIGWAAQWSSVAVFHLNTEGLWVQALAPLPPCFGTLVGLGGETKCREQTSQDVTISGTLNF